MFSQYQETGLKILMKRGYTREIIRGGNHHVQSEDEVLRPSKSEEHSLLQRMEPISVEETCWYLGHEPASYYKEKGKKTSIVDLDSTISEVDSDVTIVAEDFEALEVGSGTVASQEEGAGVFLIHPPRGQDVAV